MFIILILVVLIGIAAIYISTRSMPVVTHQKLEVKIENSPERLVQGEKLATMICKCCHYNSETHKLTGKRLDEAPEFGEIYARNITNHQTAGIIKWTDG